MPASSARCSAPTRDAPAARARSALDRDPTATIAWLVEYAAAGGSDRLAVEGLAVAAQSRGIATRLRHVAGPGALVPGSHTYVSSDRDQIVALDLDRGTRRTLMSGLGPHSVSKLSGTGGQVVATREGGEVLLVSVAPGAPAPRTVIRDAGAITTIAITGGGAAVLAGAEDGTVHVFEAATGTTRVIPCGTASIANLAVAPGGDAFVAIQDDGKASLWQLDGTGGTPLPAREAGYVRSVQFSPDHRHLAWGAANGTVVLWDLVDHRVVRFTGHTAPVMSVLFSPDGKLLVSGSNDRTVRLWDLSDPRTLAPTVTSGRTWTGHGDGVGRLVFSPDGRLLGSGAEDGSLRLWDIATGDGLALQGHATGLLSIAFAEDGRQLVTEDGGDELRVWPVPAVSGRTLLGHVRESAEVRIAGGDVISASDDDDALHVWTPATDAVRVLRAPHMTGGSLDVSHDGTTAVSAYDGMWTFDLAAGTARQLAKHDDTATFHRALIAPDGAQLATADSRGAIELRPLSGGPAKLVGKHRSDAWYLAFSPDSRWLASASIKTVRLDDLAAGRGREVPAGVQVPLDLAFSPDGARIAWSAADGVIRIWDVANAGPRELRGHVSAVARVAFSPDGTLLASTGTDRTVRLWDVATGHARVLPLPVAGVTVQFASGGRVVVAADESGALHFWDVARLRAYALVRAHRGVPSALAVAADGTWIATAGEDETLRMTPVPAVPPPIDRAWLDAVTAVRIGPADQLTTPAH